MKNTYEELSFSAEAARALAYSPYSSITVGAALLGKSGRVYLGANIENASYSATICAERSAFFKAITEGEREFVAIAIAGGKAGEEISSVFPPCGACRQVMAEFCDKDFKIVLSRPEGYDVYSLGEILPLGFGKSFM